MRDLEDRLGRARQPGDRTFLIQQQDAVGHAVHHGIEPGFAVAGRRRGPLRRRCLGEPDRPLGRCRRRLGRPRDQLHQILPDGDEIGVDRLVARRADPCQPTADRLTGGQRLVEPIEPGRRQPGRQQRGQRLADMRAQRAARRTARPQHTALPIQQHEAGPHEVGEDRRLPLQPGCREGRGPIVAHVRERADDALDRLVVRLAQGAGGVLHQAQLSGLAAQPVADRPRLTGQQALIAPVQQGLVRGGHHAEEPAHRLQLVELVAGQLDQPGIGPGET